MRYNNKIIPKQSESSIQKEIVQMLNFKKDILAFSVPNGIYFNALGKSKFAYIKKLKLEGFRNGVTDLIVVTPLKVYFIEIKTEKGKQSDDQKQFQKDIEALGYTYLLWRSYKDCENFLKIYNKKKEIIMENEKLKDKRRRLEQEFKEVIKESHKPQYNDAKNVIRSDDAKIKQAEQIGLYKKLQDFSDANGGYGSYFISYNNLNDYFFVDWYPFPQEDLNIFTPSFKTEEIAQEAIDRYIQELIINYVKIRMYKDGMSNNQKLCK